MNKFNVIAFAIKESLRGTKYKLLFVAVILFMFFLFVLIPTISIPGNTLLYQLSLFSPLDFSVTIFLSVLYAVFVTMQVYVIRTRKKASDVATAAAGEFDDATVVFTTMIGHGVDTGGAAASSEIQLDLPSQL